MSLVKKSVPPLQRLKSEGYTKASSLSLFSSNLFSAGLIVWNLYLKPMEEKGTTLALPLCEASLLGRVQADSDFRRLWHLPYMLFALAKMFFIDRSPENPDLILSKASFIREGLQAVVSLGNVGLAFSQDLQVRKISATATLLTPAVVAYDLVRLFLDLIQTMVIEESIQAGQPLPPMLACRLKKMEDPVYAALLLGFRSEELTDKKCAFGKKLTENQVEELKKRAFFKRHHVLMPQITASFLRLTSLVMLGYLSESELSSHERETQEKFIYHIFLAGMVVILANQIWLKSQYEGFIGKEKTALLEEIK